MMIRLIAFALLVHVGMDLEAAESSGDASAAGWASARGHDQYGEWADLTVLGVVQRFRLIPAGTFTMGSPPEETHRKEDETAHVVTLTKSFWMADSTCTQAFWMAVMHRSNPSIHIGDPEHRPMEWVLWENCQTMLAALNQCDVRLSARLPTEAEWEYACRAGTTTPIPGDSLDAIAWFGPSSTVPGNCPDLQPQPVELKAPNRWGLYDMLGNVQQWCSDRYGIYPTGAVTDPSGALTGSNHVCRGGGWIFNGPLVCRSAHRDKSDYRSEELGLRICIPGP
jgi:sulfatase modifying factor 1